MKKAALKLISTSVSKALATSSLRLSLTETPKYVTTIKDEVIYKKISDLNKWYTKIIGLDEVKLYHDRVVDVQERLLATQERRREIGAHLAEIRKKSNELQDQLHKVKRQEDLQKFLDLMKEETEILREEQEAAHRFSECDREEREIFTAFTNAIRDSHEKQRAQLEYTKYFGLILSITGSFLAFMYSTLKKHDLKKYIEEHLDKATANANNIANLTVPLMQNLQENKKELDRVMQFVSSNGDKILDVMGRNHNELTKLLLKQRSGDGNNALMKLERQNFNEMPDGEKLLWFSVASLVGLMILRKIFN